MSEFYPFFLIIFAGVFFSMLSRRIHIPWVIALILGGILLGPQTFNVLSISPTIEFVGQIGLIFLMFMAGLETKLSSFRGFHGGLAWLSFINGAVPFAVGLGIGFFLGYGWLSSLLIGIIFIGVGIYMLVNSKREDEIEKILSAAESIGAKIHLISHENEMSDKIKSFGSVVAMLRY